MLLTPFICIIFIAPSQGQYLENIQLTYKQDISFIKTWANSFKDLWEKELEEFRKAFKPISTTELKYQGNYVIKQNDTKSTKMENSASSKKNNNNKDSDITAAINDANNNFFDTKLSQANNDSYSNNDKNISNNLFTTNKDANFETTKISSASERNDGNGTTSSTAERNYTDQITNKYNEELDNSAESNKSCTDKNERYPIPGSCDSYIQCRDGNAEKKQCPDGLRYNHNVKPNMEPCQYPPDVKCANGSTLQPPKPTENCPNQFGYFKTEDIYNCSSFRICEDGIAYDYNCPEGLAFNSKTYRCEWPDRVPGCKVNGFLDFKCPEVINPAKLGVTIKIRSPTDCNKYFACSNGKPRQLQCDKYFAFNQQNQTCVPAFEVEECTENQINLSQAFVKKQPNGEYFVLKEDDYINDRFISLSFDKNTRKRNKVIS